MGIALFVHGVTGFVQGGEDVRVEEILVHAVGDALVAVAQVGGEGVVDLVLAAAVEVVADGAADLVTHLDLGRFGVELVQHAVVYLVGGGDLLDQFDLLGADVGEDLLDIFGLHLRFVIIQQHIVGMIVGFEQICIALVELHDLVHEGFEDGIIGFLTGFTPGGVGLGGEHGALGRPSQAAL